MTPSRLADNNIRLPLKASLAEEEEEESEGTVANAVTESWWPSFLPAMEFSRAAAAALSLKSLPSPEMPPYLFLSDENVDDEWCREVSC